MIAHILSIGDEILIGQIVNTNAAWMATFLNEHGIFVNQMKTIGDTREAIEEAIAIAEREADLILITGGLGPTKDDITKKTLADYFGLEMAYHEESYLNIVRIFQEMGRVADDRYKLQSFMPVGAQILINKTGTASGMWFERHGKIVVSMPGVPREMQYLMTNEVIPRVKTQFQLPTILHHTFQTMGKGETDLSDMLDEFETQLLPAHIKLAYLPDMMLGKIRLRLTARGNDATALALELDRCATYLRDKLGTLVFGEGDTQIENEVGKLLSEQNATLATAESCTGGNISKRITSVAGSSAYYMGSVVAYSNDVKRRVLGVKATTLEEFGAVSELTVREMVTGTLHLLGVDYAIAVSGIAGPDGGTPDKPVGTIWVAVGNKERTITRRLQLGRERSRNVEMASSIALNMLRLLLIGKYED